MACLQEHFKGNEGFIPGTIDLTFGRRTVCDIVTYFPDAKYTSMFTIIC